MAIPSAARLFTRGLATAASAHPPAAHLIYSNPRRARGAAVTLLALGQAGFWGTAVTLAHHAPQTLISPAWTVAGFGLSAAFAAMVNAYLRRNVAEIALLHPPAVRVTAHSFGGMLAHPVVISPPHIVAGPSRDDRAQRYWSFASQSSRRFYYIVDTKKGVLDVHALAALVNGGDHLLAFSHKRDARIMKDRWQRWKKTYHQNLT